MKPTFSSKSLMGWLGVLAYLAAILYLIEHFIPSFWISITFSLIGAFLLICAFFYISTISRIVVLSLISVGSYCVYAEQLSVQTAVLGFGENLNLLSLFLLIPLIGTFMSTAGYLSALKEKVQEREHKGSQHPYRLSYFLTASIGILLNYGSMAIVKRIAEESFSAYKDKKLTLNVMRAFGFCMMWSPYFVNVGLVLVLFQLSWFDIGGYAVVLAVVYLIVSWIFFRFISFKDETLVQQNDRNPVTSQNRSLTPFYIFCAVLITLSFLLDYLLHVNMLTVVSLVALLLPFLWAVINNLVKSYMQDVSEQVQHTFLRLKNELAVFISAGFFGMALSQTSFGGYVSEILFDASMGSVYLLSLFIVGLTILLAQIGIHPVIIIIGIGSSLTPSGFGVSPEFMAMLLLIAWTTSTQMSPFSGQVLMASRLMDQRPITVVRQNAVFALVLAFFLTTILYLALKAGII
ncbi:hypothetical protein [Alteribacter salitolerans]|uniref:hypothetical protein n=1 Tax=Alteribacter salitolerans TaxID=2912333 RepID=UPI001F383979|nr:hypothetical protein [Alteribacter salitolerans]